MQCRDFREVADSYLSDELLVETNHDVIAHLEACPECRRELAARRELRTSLRTAFTKTEELQIHDQFAERIRASSVTPQPLKLLRESRAVASGWQLRPVWSLPDSD